MKRDYGCLNDIVCIKGNNNESKKNNTSNQILLEISNTYDVIKIEEYTNK